MSERSLKTLQFFETSKLNTVCHQHKVAAQAAASNSNLRWLRVPATTFVITLSPSRSNRRDGFSFSGNAGVGRWSKSGYMQRYQVQSQSQSPSQSQKPLSVAVRREAEEEWGRELA